MSGLLELVSYAFAAGSAVLAWVAISSQMFR
jgi:hypothetical protein